MTSELSNIRFIRNPVPLIETGEFEDEFGEEKLFDIQSMSFALLYELENQVKAALSRGCLKSLKMIGVRASILGGEFTTRRTNELAIGRCVNQLVREMISQANPVILEPIMNVQISTPNHIMQTIVNDLISTRRGVLESI